MIFYTTKVKASNGNDVIGVSAVDDRGIYGPISDI